MRNAIKTTVLLISVLGLQTGHPAAAGTPDPARHVKGSQSEWPMSGGPNGNWQLTTAQAVPAQWSVRRGQNIKWKKPLPAGGQSGIAVWGDRLFLTVNPPLDTPPRATLVADHQRTQKAYEDMTTRTDAALIKRADPVFAGIKTFKNEANAVWQQTLSADAEYTKASGWKKTRRYNQMLKDTPQGQAFAKADAAYTQHLFAYQPALTEALKEAQIAEKAFKARGHSPDIVLLCLDANSGDTLWSQPVKGLMSAAYNYGFSDSTTPCPTTDGKHVWAINASGGMACFTMDGAPVWERTWMPTGGRPFNKQFDSILHGDLLLNVEPPVEGDAARVKDWNYLHAFDKTTGKRLWVTIDALTHYNAPILGRTDTGGPAVLIGRGGPHGVPERPVGLSLIDLRDGRSGQTIWQWEAAEDNSVSGWGAMNTQHWGDGTASWFDSHDHHRTIDTQTGTLISRHPLTTADIRRFDESQQAYVLEKDATFAKLENQSHGNISAGDHVYFLVRYQPFIGRHNVKTGHTEYLEVPRELADDGTYLWKKPHTNDGLNAKGQLHGGDARTLGNGFQKSFPGSPTKVNNLIFFTNALGMVYVIDADAERLDQDALVAVNDLGSKGETWTVNSMTYVRGRIYHRTLKEIICIEE